MIECTILTSHFDADHTAPGFSIDQWKQVVGVPDRIPNDLLLRIFRREIRDDEWKTREISDRDLLAWTRRDPMLPETIDPATGSLKLVIESGEVRITFLDSSLHHEQWHTQLTWLNLELLPRSHRHHRLATLAPIPGTPWSEKHQADMIKAIPEAIAPLRGWLICGPPGTSKTTFLSAWVADFQTLQAIDGKDRKYAGIARIKAPEWLDVEQRKATRKFGSEDLEQWTDIEELFGEDVPPRYRAQDNRPHAVWIDELDKVRMTPFRSETLFSLIDRIYEEGGVILATSNKTPEELREHLGDAIYRRIAGTYEAPEEKKKFQVWDLFPLCRKSATKKSAGKV